MSKFSKCHSLVFFSFNALCLYLGDIFFFLSTGTVTRKGAKITTGPLVRSPKSEMMVCLGDSQGESQKDLEQGSKYGNQEPGIDLRELHR